MSRPRKQDVRVHYNRFPCTPHPRFDEHTRAAIDGRDIETSRARKPTFGLLRPGPVCGAIRQNLWSSTPSKQLIWWNPEHALQKDMRQHLPQNRAGDERPPDIAFAREELPLTVRDAATYLGISAQTGYLWVERKQIPHLRVMGRNIRFLKSDLAKPFLICSSVLLYLLRRLCLLLTLYSSSKNDGRKDESPSR
jgi:excisionase family DNA binding protein